MIFENRQEAGKQLAIKLAKFQDESPIVLALPRGGIPIGFEIAKALHAPMDVLVVRKIGSPYNPELGIGAIAEDNVQVLDESTINLLKISKKELNRAINKQRKEVKRRVTLYRNNNPLPILKNKVIILVDDGLATGVTARCAIAFIKKRKPRQLIFASPVCAYGTVGKFKNLVDNVICITTPVNFAAVGSWYRQFEQVTDEEATKILQASGKS